MELALYCPEYGFYERETDSLGRQGAFFTSVSVGHLFGELLAFQFADWLEGGRRNGQTPRLIETGAYRGQLAGDILGWLKSWRPELFEVAEYWIVEPSARLRSKQKDALRGFVGKVEWFPDLAALPNAGIHGVIFSNELLDAIPVKRLGWDAGKRAWFEWGVSMEGEKFIWTRIPGAVASEPEPQLTEQLRDVLPDGYTIEVNPNAYAWWTAAAGKLKSGKLLALDYGFTTEEWITPERTNGTLRTYSQHRVGDQLLADPGEQDITAHVNFSMIQHAGESVGLKTDCLVSQEKFIIGIAAQTWNQPERFGQWDDARRKQFQTLVHPQHLGRSFRVLVQTK